MCADSPHGRTMPFGLQMIASMCKTSHHCFAVRTCVVRLVRCMKEAKRARVDQHWDPERYEKEARLRGQTWTTCG